MVNTNTSLRRSAERVFQDIFSELPGVVVQTRPIETVRDDGYDLLVKIAAGKNKFQFAVQVRSRVTPQTVLSTCNQLKKLSPNLIPVVFAPVISPRVAEIIRQCGIGYVDRSGNCWLRSAAGSLLIERRGLSGKESSDESVPIVPRTADLFSTKSSRIVRAMLSQPMKGWQVRELAEAPEVEVSPGLVVKVKRALLQEGYAIEHDKRLFLRDPVALLNDWSQRYPGPVEQIQLYFRGEGRAAEQAVGEWCQTHHLRHALGGLSAAWRLAPEVRYHVATIFVEDAGFNQRLLERLAVERGGKQVDSGHNLVLWRPYDRSVFASPLQDIGSSSDVPKIPVTSALQTYLDLKRATGRAAEASKALFEKYLRKEFQQTVAREGGLWHGAN